MDCWLNDLLQYAEKHELYVEDIPPTLRHYHNDNQFLMGTFIDCGYHKKDLQTGDNAG
jgi:hypothetical protein